MKRIGITGGIASGKSAVAGMLRESGFRVMDADRVGHEVIKPGSRLMTKLSTSLARELWGQIDASIAGNWERLCLQMQRNWGC